MRAGDARAVRFSLIAFFKTRPPSFNPLAFIQSLVKFHAFLTALPKRYGHQNYTFLCDRLRFPNHAVRRDSRAIWRVDRRKHDQSVRFLHPGGHADHRAPDRIDEVRIIAARRRRDADVDRAADFDAQTGDFRAERTARSGKLFGTNRRVPEIRRTFDRSHQRESERRHRDRRRVSGKFAGTRRAGNGRLAEFADATRRRFVVENGRGTRARVFGKIRRFRLPVLPAEKQEDAADARLRHASVAL